MEHVCFLFLFLGDGVGEGGDDGGWGGGLEKKEEHVCKLTHIRFISSHFLSDDDGGDDDDDDNNKKRTDKSCFSIAKCSQFV